MAASTFSGDEAAPIFGLVAADAAVLIMAGVHAPSPCRLTHQICISLGLSLALHREIYLRVHAAAPKRAPARRRMPAAGPSSSRVPLFLARWAQAPTATGGASAPSGQIVGGSLPCGVILHARLKRREIRWLQIFSSPDDDISPDTEGDPVELSYSNYFEIWMPEP